MLSAVTGFHVEIKAVAGVDTKPDFFGSFI